MASGFPVSISVNPGPARGNSNPKCLFVLRSNRFCYGADDPNFVTRPLFSGYFEGIAFTRPNFTKILRHIGDTIFIPCAVWVMSPNYTRGILADFLSRQHRYQIQTLVLTRALADGQTASFDEANFSSGSGTRFHCQE